MPWRDDFAGFVRESLPRGVSQVLHLKPQYHFVCDEDGEVLVDFLGDFGALERDFGHVLDRLQAKGRARDVSGLPHKNRSSKADFRRAYDSETRERVEEIYGRDLDLFEYDFGSERRRRTKP